MVYSLIQKGELTFFNEIHFKYLFCELHSSFYVYFEVENYQILFQNFLKKSNISRINDNMVYSLEPEFVLALFL